MKKIITTILLILTAQLAYAGDIVQTNTMTFTDTVTMSNLTVIGGINMSGKVISNQAPQTIQWLTNTIVVTNSLSSSIALPVNGLNISEIRLYINTTNGIMPYSAPFKYEFYNHSDRRADNLVFSDVGATTAGSQPTTNGYLTCVTNTAISVLGATTNVVSDASSFIIGDTSWQQQLTGGSNGFHRITAISGNLITHGTTNRTDYMIGSIYSHVERCQGTFYYDFTGTSNLWYTFTFTANVTNSLGVQVGYLLQ
jgi:hypothetical protein